MSEARQHKLFEQFPLKGEREISVGRVPVPYHIYDGHGLLIGGTADLSTVTALLQREQVQPLQTSDGRALMAIWICDFNKASLGAHNELQVAIAVSHQPISPLESHPLSFLKGIFVNPDVRLLCHGLWNNTEKVVAYNRELLGLNAQLNQGQIKRGNGIKSFTFRNAAGELIVQGQVREAKYTPMDVGWQLAKLLGFKQTIRAFTQPYIGTQVVNIIGDVIAYNADAPAYLSADTPVVQYFDPTTDSITFYSKPYRDIGFRPLFLEHFEPFRFVYLTPRLS